MIRQVKVENFREQIAPNNNKLSGKNCTEGGIFLPRSSSFDSLRVVYPAEKAHSFYPISPLPICQQQSPKGVTQLRNYNNNTIQIIDKNEYCGSSSSLNGSPNASPCNYSPSSPSSLIICSSSNISNTQLNTLIRNNMTQQNQQFSNHGIRTLQCAPQGYGQQKQILVQVVQPSVSLKNGPTTQQKSPKICENTISQAQKKLTQQKQISGRQQILTLVQQKQHQAHQEQQKIDQNEITSTFRRVISSSPPPSDENENQFQNDRTLIETTKINDMHNEIQRLLGVNEKLTQETHSWRQKYELSEIRRQIVEQDQTTQMMKDTPSAQELDSSRQVSEFSATQITSSNNNPLQAKQIKEQLRVRSPSCGSLEDSKGQTSIQEKQRNFQQIVQQLSSLENLKKTTTDSSDVQNPIFALQEENTILKQRLELWAQLERDRQEREKAEFSRQQLEIQRLDTTCKNLQKQLEIACKSENSKDQIIRDLEKDKEILQARLNHFVQDLSKGLSQQSEAGRIISYFDKRDIFYHSMHSQETKNGFTRGKKAAMSGNTLKIEKTQLAKGIQSSNTSCANKTTQEYRYNSSRNSNNSPSSQSSSNAPSIEHSQANDILEKTSNLTRVIHPFVQHPSSSVKTIEYTTSHASSQQSSQQHQQKQYQQQPSQEKQRFEITTQECNEYHSQFSFHPEQLQIISQNTSREEERKGQSNQSNSEKCFNHSQQNIKKAKKDNQFIDNPSKLSNEQQQQQQQGYSHRFQHSKNQGNNNFHAINEIETTLVGRQPCFFEEKENQSISKREFVYGNYSFSQKENCTSEINQN